ncbi:flagellin [Halopiger aswanensis]|uniref:Flagellar protein FlaF n=1 Tax=Halopiger aswanensis TaxID=148449 RepID=A0A419WK64_9EURY|nr:flagellin [Halopiger aswanensis]RKD95844.1 flagellar protein FlaF [Halopiger aswanensis]
MGFSTSGAIIVILIGVLVAVSAIVPTVFNITGTTGDAFSAKNDQFREQTNTEIAIESFETGSTADAVVNVTNDGARSLSVEQTDVVVNGEYYPTNASDTETTIVTNDSTRPSSDVWLPRTVLQIELDNAKLESDSEITGDGDHVRITTENGIAATAEINGGA